MQGIMARQAFLACGCDGMARVDLFLDRATGSFSVSELNGIPGFTAISMYPRLLSLSGIDYPEVLATLIDAARRRHRRRSSFAQAALRPLADRVGSRGKG